MNKAKKHTGFLNFLFCDDNQSYKKTQKNTPLPYMVTQDSRRMHTGFQKSITLSYKLQKKMIKNNNIKFLCIIIYMFSTLFEKYFEITDKIIDKQSLLTFKDIWMQMITDELYHKNTYRYKREFNKKSFY